MANAPVSTIRDRNLSAAIFKNETKDGKIWYSTKVVSTYTKDDKYHETNSFGQDELLRVSRLTEKAYDAIADLYAAAKA